MMRRIFLAFSVLVLGFAGTGCQSSPQNGITQVATIDALLAGVYEGHLTLGELRHHGDFGLGTFEGLDGEMILLDGKFYQIRSDGRVYRPALSERTPFASVTRFAADHRETISHVMDMKTLEEKVDTVVPQPNRLCAFIVRGEFNEVRTRSVARQNKPYPPLVEVTKTQPVFQMSHVRGTLIGFRAPPFVKGVNVPGYHLHFLADDLSGGGHVLSFEMARGTLEADTRHDWLQVYLPSDSAAFGGANLEADRTSELYSAEKDSTPRAATTATAPVLPGASVSAPVDDARFDRLGRTARAEAAATHEFFTSADLAAALQRRASLGLTAPPASTAALSDDELHRRAAQATLVMFTVSEKNQTTGVGIRTGTAFMVHPGIAVTCFHALKNLGNRFIATAFTVEGRPVKVKKILAAYPEVDLAFLQVEGAGDTVLPLRADAPAGIHVRAVGHPLNRYYFTIEGLVARYGLKAGAGADPIIRMHLIIASIGGFSGAALVDSRGNAVGMLDSFDAIQSGDADYAVQSAIPAAAILDHFTNPSESTPDAETVANLLRELDKEITVYTIRCESPDGVAIAEASTQTPDSFLIRIEDAGGKKVAQGRSSPALRESLPKWAHDLYDQSIRDARKKVAPPPPHP